MPKTLRVSLLFDQSISCGCGHDVLKEGGVAAGLTALMILLFLGSWRSR